MSTKSCSKKKLVKLQVDKYDDVDHAIVSGECKGSSVRKVLNKVDPKKCFWSNAEINSVSESFGLLVGSVPAIIVDAVGTIVNNAILSPLKRVIKNRKCNKDDDASDEHDCDEHDCDEHDCDEHDCDEDDYNDCDEHDDASGEACGCDATRTIDCSEDDCSEDDCSEDYVCKKKKKNPFSTLWNKIAKRK